MKRAAWFTAGLLLLAALPAEGRRLHYFEELYRLHAMELVYGKHDMARNIRYLQYALKAPFDHPVRALVPIRTEEGYRKYKHLMRMHVNLLIVKNTLRTGWQFDKENLYFFNRPYRDDLGESFRIARHLYLSARPYWQEAVRHARRAAVIRERIGLDPMEDEALRIVHGQLDYGPVIDRRIREVEWRLSQVDRWIAESPTD